MAYVRPGLFAEGPTDYGLLSPLLRRLTEQLCREEARGVVDVEDVVGLDAPARFRSADRTTRILEAARPFWGGSCVLFIHADGAGAPEAKEEEQITPGIRRIEQELPRGACVAVVPVREALGHLFAVLVWGELAAWNIAADLARALPDVDAKMAATGQVFDEARHFAVLREYLRRAGIDLPRLNPYGRRTLQITLATDSVIEKLYGMQLTVENLAVAIFKRVQAANVEPVLTDLLAYVERDESRHVALGVLYLPRLLGRATPLQRLSNWRFNLEIFFLTMAGGELLDPHLEALGIDHRELGSTVMNMHRQVLRRMEEEEGLAPGSGIKGVYSLTAKQNRFLLDFLHPDRTVDRSPRQRFARDLFHRATVGVARFLD